MKLDESLKECTLALLRRIAEAHSVSHGEDSLRSELASLISERLLEPGYLDSYVPALPNEEHAVIAYLAGHDWAGKAFLLERQFPRGSSDLATQSPCSSLLHRGLLYRTFGAIDSWRGEIYHIPEDLRPALSGVVTLRRPEPALDIAIPGECAATEECDAALDLFSLLAYLHRADRRSYRGFLSRHDLPKLEQEAPHGGSTVRHGDIDTRWRLLLRLCFAAGWVWRDGPLLRPGRGAVQALSGTRVEVRNRLVDRYLREQNWSDLEGAGRVRQHQGSRRIDEAGARQIVIHYLTEWASSGWVTEQSFRDAIRSANPDFLREDYASLGSAVVDTASGTELSGSDSWDLVEGEWIRFVLHGPLYWLGLVTWGLDGKGTRTVFRHSPLHHAAVKSSSEPVLFSEDLTAVAPSGASLSRLYRLEPFMAFRRTEPAGRVYRLTSSSVHRGLESGATPDEFLSLVHHASGGLVPERVRAQLEEWALAYGRLILEGSLLLTGATEEALAEVAALPGVAALLSERAGPLSYRVADRRFWQLLNTLREAGHPPRLDPSAGTLRARHATGDPAVLKDALFALLLVRLLYGYDELEAGAETQRALEVAIGAEAADGVARRVQDAARRIRSRSEFNR